MREHTFFESGEEHNGKLQAFCSMQSHEHDTIVAIYLVGIGNKCNLFKKIVNRVELFCKANEFSKVL